MVGGMDYLTIAQAAELMGISPRALRNRIERGEVEAVRVNPRLLMVLESEARKWEGRGKMRPWEARRVREAQADQS